MAVEQTSGFKGQGPTAGDTIKTVNTPDGLQGLRTYRAAEAVCNPLDVNGSTVKTGDIMRTRLTGGLGHATLHSKTPSSGHKFRDDQGGGHSGKGTSSSSQHWS